MSMLIDRLPENVEINGKVYKIRTDFRTSILFETMMLDEEFPDELKGSQAIDLYFYEPPPIEYGEEALKRIIEFYSCGKTENPGKSGKISIKEIYSFEYDDDYIFAAFYQQYGIDLTDTNLHWWKFKALFKSLCENCKIVEIMGYRSTDLSDIPKEKQKFYRSMKKLYELPISKSEQERIEEIENRLMGGDTGGL